MAEVQAFEVPAQNNFFCHKCSTEIVPQVPEYVCPQCHSGFIEPIGGVSSSSSSSSGSSSDGAGASGSSHGAFDPDSDDHSTGSSFDAMEELEPSLASTLGSLIIGAGGMNPFLVGASGVTELMGAAGEPSGEGGTAPASGGRRYRNRALNSLLMRGTLNRRNRLRGPDRHTVLGPMLQDLIVHISPSGPIGVPMFHTELAGNPGDYVWGRGSLDAVITHLMSQLENSGAPPLSATQIDDIPQVPITEEQIKNNSQCSVCMEDFLLEESVKKLSCDHCFHESCISPWLQMHATCPVCRKTLSDPAAGDAPTAAPSNAPPQPGTAQQPNTSRLVVTPGSSMGNTLTFTISREDGSSSDQQSPSTSAAASGSAAHDNDDTLMEEDLD